MQYLRKRDKFKYSYQQWLAKTESFTLFIHPRVDTGYKAICRVLRIHVSKDDVYYLAHRVNHEQLFVVRHSELENRSK